MPSVPLAATASATRTVQFSAPDPNLANDIFANPQSAGPSYQSSPAVVATSSHMQLHILPRRFLGPMPESVLHSDAVQERRRRLVELRRAAVRRLRRGDDDEVDLEDFASETIARRGVGGVLHRIKIRSKNHRGEDVEEDLELDSDNGDDEGATTPRGSKGKKKRKDVWMGESFDIGREFTSLAVRNDDHLSDEDGGEQAGPSSRPSIRTRPSNTSRTTQETFVTARSHPSDVASASASRSTLGINEHGLVEGYELDEGPQHSPVGTNSLLDHNARTRESQSSSTTPLVGTIRDSNEVSAMPTLNKKNKGGLKSPSLTFKLKSALRHSSRQDLRGAKLVDGDAQSTIPPLPRDRQEERPTNGKSKSVQFPVDHARVVTKPHDQVPSVERAKLRKGNEAPADPGEVLSREGEEAVGTSAGAVEEAMEEWEEEDEPALPGEIIMRDRMLVRVGMHRGENISLFDEAAQRRNPCARLEAMEEYIVVWRKGQVELYQDYRTPLREKISGYKRLCFVIPLNPSRTSLSIFNANDMTLCLTTSIHRLKQDAERILKGKGKAGVKATPTASKNGAVRRETTARMSAMKASVKDSRQVQWLRNRTKGTQVFILKIAEKSRAMDWYWELWRELGGELPTRIDIEVPALDTSVRLAIPHDDEDDIVGGVNQRRLLDVEAVKNTCWELLKGSIDVGDLRRQREESGLKEGTHLGLAWKGEDGTLEWVAYTTTVEKKPRKWAVLAGIARGLAEPDRKHLQLRPARHQPQAIRLEDGTWLEEPPNVEGYLIRHKDASAAKEHVYLSTHDGNIFVANMRDAHPPLVSQKEGSTPANLFRDVHRSFLDHEHRRMASFVEHSAGCIDLRNIASVQLLIAKPALGQASSRGSEDEHSHAPKDPKKAKEARTFEVTVDTGGVIRLEAQSPEVAAEWVERLIALKGYWAKRHRVDARQAMDAMTLQAHDDPFAGTQLSSETDIALSEIWDWCAIDGCRPICLAGRIFMKRDKWHKFRLRYVILTGGCLVTFKIKKKDAYHVRKKRYPLFGAYIYSGMLAQDELHESTANPLTPQARVYQDGLQASDGNEDTTFCIRLAAQPKVWGKKRTQPWEKEDDSDVLPPGLSRKAPVLLIFRARSKLERDRWIWALNAEMERQVRAHVKQEATLRNYGNVPARWM